MTHASRWCRVPVLLGFPEVRIFGKCAYRRGPAIAPPRDKPAKGALFVSGGAKSTQYFMLF